jgi:hypothetical protein
MPLHLVQHVTALAQLYSACLPKFKITWRTKYTYTENEIWCRRISYCFLKISSEKHMQLWTALGSYTGRIYIVRLHANSIFSIFDVCQPYCAYTGRGWWTAASCTWSVKLQCLSESDTQYYCKRCTNLCLQRVLRKQLRRQRRGRGQVLGAVRCYGPMDGRRWCRPLTNQWTPLQTACRNCSLRR